MRMLRSSPWWLALILPGLAHGAIVNVAVGGPAGFAFAPAEVTVRQGDTVRFTNAGGFHNVKADDNSFEHPAEPISDPWVFDLVVSQPGDIRYFCEAHGGPGGVGMAGVVRVLDVVFADGFE